MPFTRRAVGRHWRQHRAAHDCRAGGLADVGRDLIRTPTAEGRSRPPKLTAAQQAEARRRRAEGATLAELARSYHVGKSTISRLTATTLEKLYRLFALLSEVNESVRKVLDGGCPQRKSEVPNVERSGPEPVFHLSGSESSNPVSSCAESVVSSTPCFGHLRIGGAPSDSLTASRMGSFSRSRSRQSAASFNCRGPVCRVRPAIGTAAFGTSFSVYLT